MSDAPVTIERLDELVTMTGEPHRWSFEEKDIEAIHNALRDYKQLREITPHAVHSVCAYLKTTGDAKCSACPAKESSLYGECTRGCYAIAEETINNVLVALRVQP